MPDYLEEFPIQGDLLPARLRALLEGAGNEPTLRIDVATRYEFDTYGPDREYVHMLMTAVPSHNSPLAEIPREASNGVVSFSQPDVRERGGLERFDPSVSGFDYIVASRGDGSFYSFSLAEKVWMALGLSCRCLGGEEQRLVYDDLSLPVFGVAEGDVSTEYYFSPKRDVNWVMSNEYLRRYLWMRGAYGTRVFFYETLLPDVPEIRALMVDEPQVIIKPEGGWYELDIREHRERLLIQVWASVVAVTPELCPEQRADEIYWPGVDGAMDHGRANALTNVMPVYLDDRFLERYEQSQWFETVPIKVGDRWNCSPSYLGQWGFTDCSRVGRNLVKVPMRELYKAKPDREILHAHTHAIDLAHLADIDWNEEHIVAKTQRFVDELLRFGDHLAALSVATGNPKSPEEIVGFSRAELRDNGWLHYPELCRLGQVAPVSMTEQAFLSRCKRIHELWQRIPNKVLRNIVLSAGHVRSDLKDFGSLKLLQALANILERLVKDGEDIEAFSAGSEPSDLDTRNIALAPLFKISDLRNADAHEVGDNVLGCLEALGFDPAMVNEGYGRALDFVFDGAIQSFAHVNQHLFQIRQH